MAPRFHPVNVPSRAKRKEIPNETWEEHEQKIAQQLQRGLSVEKLARYFESRKIPGFTPSVRQLRRRIKSKGLAGSLNVENSTLAQDDVSAALDEQDLEENSHLTNDTTEPGSTVDFHDMLNKDIPSSCFDLLTGLIQAPAGFLPDTQTYDEYGINAVDPPNSYNPIANPDTSDVFDCHIYESVPTYNESFSGSIDIHGGNSEHNHFDGIGFFPLQRTECSPFISTFPVNFGQMDQISFASLLSKSSLDPIQYSFASYDFDLLTRALHTQRMVPAASSTSSGSLLSRYSHSNLITGTAQMSSDQLLRLMVFMIDNNFINDPPIRKTLLLFVRSATPNTLETVLRLTELDADEFARKVLLLAVEAGNWSLFSALIKKGIPCKDREAAFRAAVELQNLDMVKELINQGIPYEERETTFHEAVKLESWDIVKELIQSGLRPNEAQKSRWERDFNFVCAQRNLQLIGIFLEAGVDPKRIDDDYANPVYAATRGRDPFTQRSFAVEELVDMEIIHALVDAGACINTADTETSIHLPRHRKDICLSILEAITQGHVELVRYLIDKGAKVGRGTGERSALQHLFQNWRQLKTTTALAIAKDLIQGGVNVKERYKVDGILDGCGRLVRNITALDYAARIGSVELFQLLQGAGATIGPETLNHAMEASDSNIAEYLLDNGAIIPEDCYQVVQRATQKRMHGFMQKLIRLASTDQRQWTFTKLGGNAEMVELLLNSGVIPKTFEELNIALDAAALAGELALVKRLLIIAVEKQEEWDLSQLRGISSALGADHYEIVEYLIHFGAHIGEDELNTAIKKRNPKLAQRLISLMACTRLDLSHKAVLALIEFEDLAIAKSLLDICYFGGHSRHEAICAAVLGEKHEMVRMLISKGPEATVWETGSNKKCGEILAWLAANRDVSMLQLLFELGADPHSKRLLGTVADARNYNAVQTILLAYKKRYTTLSGGGYVCEQLISSVVQLDLVMVHMLLSFGADPLWFDQFGDLQFDELDLLWYYRSAFGHAIEVDKSDNLFILSAILDKDPDLNSIVATVGLGSGRHITALVAAIEVNHFPSIKLLIQRGADIHLAATRQTERNPLQAACAVGNLEAVQYLLDLGADVNSPAFEINGATALQFAAISGHMGIACILLSHGANLDAPRARINGRTALEGAAEHGRVAMVDLLLKSGVSIEDSGTEQYERALRFAERNGHKKVKSILEWALTQRRMARRRVL